MIMMTLPPTSLESNRRPVPYAETRKGALVVNSRGEGRGLGSFWKGKVGKGEQERL